MLWNSQTIPPVSMKSCSPSPRGSFWCTRQILRLGCLVTAPVRAVANGLSKIFWKNSSPSVPGDTCRATVQESPVPKRVEERGEGGESAVEEKPKDPPVDQGVDEEEEESQAIGNVQWNTQVVENEEEMEVEKGVESVCGGCVEQEEEKGTLEHLDGKKSMAAGPSGNPARSLQEFSEMWNRLEKRKRRLRLYDPPAKMVPDGFFRIPRPRFVFDLRARTMPWTANILAAAGVEVTPEESLRKKFQKLAVGSVGSEYPVYGSDNCRGVDIANQDRKRRRDEQPKIFSEPSGFDQSKYETVRLGVLDEQKRLKKDHIEWDDMMDIDEEY